ncbi:FtsK/SpoIIIE domain-containing protein [Streptomyces globosus]|uniref:FtsK/SpoIIIE domain-containing protein n=1 Tax=Streptomyces globosus TaxID=68209 RepID=UPI0038229EF8
MGKRTKKDQQEQDLYAQGAGAIGGLVIVFGILAAIKDTLGLSWPATVLVLVGALVLLGYGAYKARQAVRRLMERRAQPAAPQQQTEVAEAPEAAASVVQAHPELTEALVTAGVIDKTEVIRADEVTITPIPTGKQFNFLLPKTRTFKDVEGRIANVAGWFGVSRLHVKLERSRENERRVHLLVLAQPPFSQPFPHPSRHEIQSFAGVPLGHDVTGQLVGIPTFDKASMLVGGMSQMGKTTFINGLITCLLIAYGDFELYLLDGKICGFIRFENACTRYESSDDPAVFESMVDALNDRVERRYRRKQEALRNREPEPRFKPVFFIVDEVADFFADDGTPKGKERAARIAEKARKLVARALESGISSIMLTQRPDKDAIPVNVRNQFLIRFCMYVESKGTARVALGDSYFESAAPIDPTRLNPDIKGQGVLFAGGTSTLIRGFHFPDSFTWEVVDQISARQTKEVEKTSAPHSPLMQAIELMRNKGVDFMATADLAPALGITETQAATRGKKLSALLGVKPSKDEKNVTRGYWLADLMAAARSDP